MDEAVVGRESELKAIEHWLEAPSPVLLIEGEAGIGKTTLWRSGIQDAVPTRHEDDRPVKASVTLL